MMYVAVLPTPSAERGAQRAETIGRFFAAIQSGDAAVLQEELTPDAITR
jgi:ketosteroid isomerase-like protein